VRDPGDVSKDELRELLGKGWLTHDGAWFFSVAAEMGMEAANRMNKAAIKAMAPFETRRTMKVLQVDPADLTDCASLVRFVTAGLGLIMPDSILDNLHFDCSDDNTIHWSWEPGRCFAYKGMSQMGGSTTTSAGSCSGYCAGWRSWGSRSSSTPTRSSASITRPESAGATSS